MNVQDMKADGWTIGCLCCPEVQVVVLSASFEEECVVATGQFTEFIDEWKVVLGIEL